MPASRKAVCWRPSFNDLFDVVTNNLDVFADDSTLWATIPSVGDRAAVASSLTKDLLAIASWAEAWLVTFNTGKTEALILSKHHDMTEFRKNPIDKKTGKYLDGPTPCPHPPLAFGSLLLPESPRFKVVGLTFQGNLSWALHVTHVYKKGRRALGIVRRARHVLSKQTIAVLYKSHVRSTMEYACPIWMGNTSTELGRLDSVQRSAARLMGPWGKDLQSLSHRRGVAALSSFHRIVYGSAPQPILRFRPQDTPLLSRPSRSASLIRPCFAPPRVARVPLRLTPTYWLNSFVPLLTRAWNEIAPEVRQLSNPHVFKTNVKNSSLPLSLVTLSVTYDYLIAATLSAPSLAFLSINLLGKSNYKTTEELWASRMKSRRRRRRLQ